VSRRQFCKEFLNSLIKNRDIVNNFNDVRWGSLPDSKSGYVDIQNCRYWSPNKPYEHTLHCAEATLRCANSSRVIIGLCLLENTEGPTVTVNAERYKVTLESFLRNELHPYQLHFLWFRQDGGSAHTTQISVLVFRAVFPVRLISRFEDITLPPRSPDLTVSVTNKCLIQTVIIQMNSNWYWM